MQNELLMPFINQSHAFTLGVECGMIWEKIKSGECFDYHPVHRENAEQLRLMGEALGANIEISEGDDTWQFFTIKSAIHGL